MNLKTKTSRTLTIMFYEVSTDSEISMTDGLSSDPHTSMSVFWRSESWWKCQDLQHFFSVYSTASWDSEAPLFGAISIGSKSNLLSRPFTQQEITTLQTKVQDPTVYRHVSGRQLQTLWAHLSLRSLTYPPRAEAFPLCESSFM